MGKGFDSNPKSERSSKPDSTGGGGEGMQREQFRRPLRKTESLLKNWGKTNEQDHSLFHCAVQNEN